MAKRLPKGLLEFEGSLHDLEYAPQLLPRLRELPESSFDTMMREFQSAMLRAAEAEARAVSARAEARNIALTMWAAAKKNWSVKELQEATGYDDE